MTPTFLLNIISLFLFQSLFCAYFLYQIKQQKDSAPSTIFERSLPLLILANTLNFLESILNMTQGILYLDNENKVTPVQVMILFALIYLSRFYSACMCLRILRIYFLHRYRRGKIQKKTLTRVSSVKFFILTTNTYSLLSLLAITLVVNYLELPSIYLSYINNLCFGYEAVTFLILSSIEQKMNSHPTLYVEYFIYSIIWSSGCVSSINHLSYRWMIEAPIRNNMLLFVSWYSIKRHLNFVRPPLPLELEIFHVFQFKELFEDFSKFIRNCQVDDWVSACSVLGELTKASFYGKYDHMDFSLNGSSFDCQVEEWIQNKKYTQVKQRASDCLSQAFAAYKESEQHFVFKRKYDVIYN